MINNREVDATIYVVMGIVITIVLAIILHSWWDSGLKDDYEDRLADRDETIRAQYLEIIKDDPAALAEAVEYVDDCTRGYSFMSEALKKAEDKDKKSEDKEAAKAIDEDPIWTPSEGVGRSDNGPEPKDKSPQGPGGNGKHPDGLDVDDLRDSPQKPIGSSISGSPTVGVYRDNTEEDFIELIEKDADVHQDALVYVAQYLIRTSSIDIIDGNYDKDPHSPEIYALYD